MQTQGDVGIFRRIGCGLLQFDLVEGELLGPLAGDLFERDGLNAQILPGQGVHVVTAGGGVEHIGFEHGVEGDALQIDAVVLQHVAIVLEVLPHLEAGRIFQQRLELAQHLLFGQLGWSPQIVVAEGNIGRLARLDGERHANHSRLHIVETGSLGVEGKQGRRFQQCQPVVELGLLQNAAVVGLDGSNRSGGVISGLFLPGALFATGLQLLDQVAQFVLAVDRQQGLLVDRAQQQLFETLLQLHVCLDGCQLIGEANLFLLLAELVGKRLGATKAEGGDLVEVGGDLIDAAYPLQQRLGRLLAHPCHAGNVVHLVPHQGQVVDDELGGHAELLDHPFPIGLHILHGVDQGDMVGDQLRHVLVTCADEHGQLFLGRLAGERADHVVGLDPFDHQEGEAHRLDHLVNGSDLAAQIVRHAGAGRLVLGVDVVTEGLALGVEHHGHMAVGVLLAQAAHHVGHHPDGAAWQTGRCAQIGLLGGEEGAVKI
ncbi:hypothetical protein D3C78_634850 [compost metagenome]